MLRKIRFHKAPAKDFPDKKRLKECLIKTLQNQGLSLSSLQYTFTSDEELRKMNVEFLAHDYYTDILTFDLSDQPHEIEGDIYISRDRVRENALRESVQTEEEFCRVIAHGLLHLCGFKDKTKSEQESMRKEENNFISLFRSQG
jgi:probable rRNA maturation factor